jgi:hypothetical protein
MPRDPDSAHVHVLVGYVQVGVCGIAYAGPQDYPAGA